MSGRMTVAEMRSYRNGLLASAAATASALWEAIPVEVEAALTDVGVDSSVVTRGGWTADRRGRSLYWVVRLPDGGNVNFVIEDPLTTGRISALREHPDGSESVLYQETDVEELARLIRALFPDQPFRDLGEFFDHVAEVQQAARDAGVCDVYVEHDTLTPGQIRAVLRGLPVSEAPKVGDVLDLPSAGYYGAAVRWRVKTVTLLASGVSYTVVCEDVL